jgi:phosphoglycolate phosphatase
MTKPAHPKRPVIVFDFDGTLADTFLLAMNALMRRLPMAVEDTARLRGLGLRELAHELGIHLWRLPFLGWQVRQQLARELDTIELIPGIEATIKQLSKHYHLFILSANSASNVRSVLTRLGIVDEFVGIYGKADFLRKDRSLRRLLRQNQLKPDDVWYVGDQARDITAAHRVGMRAAAVSWGFNNIAALERHHPDVLVFSPEELLIHFDKQRAKA